MKLLFCLALTSVFFCQFAVATPVSRIQIRKDGETVAIVGNLTGRIRVRADKSKNIAQNTTVLAGNVAVTVANGGKKAINLRADEVIIESNSIEIQVRDYRYEEQMGWVDHLSDVSGEPQAPREAFSKALKIHSQINYFRMRFGILLGGDGADSTILYNRKQRTLKYYERGSEDDGRRRYSVNYLYTGVTDKVIEALVKKYEKTDGGYTHGHFGLLTEFGCKRFKL